MNVMTSASSFHSPVTDMSCEARIDREVTRRNFAKRAARQIHRTLHPEEARDARSELERKLAFRRLALPAGTPVHGRRTAILARAVEVELRTVQRSRAALLLKLRIAYGIPLHEWADALNRVRGVEVILQVYSPDAEASLPSYVAPRCPPWASRRYRSTPAEIAPAVDQTMHAQARNRRAASIERR